MSLLHSERANKKKQQMNGQRRMLEMKWHVSTSNYCLIKKKRIDNIEIDIASRQSWHSLNTKFIILNFRMSISGQSAKEWQSINRN